MERSDNGKRGRPFGPVDGSTSGRSSPHSLSRTISPPRKRCRQTEPDGEAETRAETRTRFIRVETRAGPGTEIVSNEGPTLIPSPFRLTHIRDLDAQANVDTVTLQDIIGDPLISECWNFNYLHNVDFLMNAFDDDTRCLVKVHIVHGFWRKDDTRRLVLYEDASRYQNVTLHSAFIPEMFGTHHSKMLILLRHDDTAQVVIHTANMIPKDWTNMAQGVWLSPRLPLLSSRDAAHDENSTAEGSGQKFKLDLLSYLRAYDVPRITCRPLIRELEKYDFSAIRGTLIASVPGRHPTPPRGDGHNNGSASCYWGWVAMKKALQSVPIQPRRQDDGKPEVVIQVSSIATLGPTDVWLRQTLFDALSGGKKAEPPDATIFKNLGQSADKPEFKVVFPTPDEIRRSLDGYRSGGSIHTKIESPQQVKQLLYLKPMFCHWAHDAPRGEKLADDALVQDAGRKRAAPHVKTYVRYDGRTKSPEWALLTSANLSKQAWGEAMNPAKEVRIASWEIGVLVWPALYANDARMTTVFGTDAPSKAAEGDSRLEETPVVGLRVPYNLPLQRYGKDEVPWVATSSYKEPDWIGNTWDP